MEYRFQYHSEEERESLLAEHSDKHLISVENITEGNFIVFSDKLPLPPNEEITSAVLFETQYQTVLIEMLAGF